MRHVRAAALVIVAGLGVSACSGGHSAASAPAAPAPKVVTMVTMGGSATEGDGVEDRLHNAWPYLVYNEARPATSALVNAAVDGATVAQAITTQVPFARETKPDLVAIWLGADDVRAAIPVASFERDLTLLIRSSQAAGATRVLVADLPTAIGGPSTAAYNAAIRRAVASTRANLVELATINVTLVPADGLPDQPDHAAHRAIADAFERVLRGS